LQEKPGFGAPHRALGYVFLAREGLALAALTQSPVDEEKLGWET